MFDIPSMSLIKSWEECYTLFIFQFCMCILFPFSYAHRLILRRRKSNSYSCHSTWTDYLLIDSYFTVFHVSFFFNKLNLLFFSFLINIIFLRLSNSRYRLHRLARWMVRFEEGIGDELNLQIAGNVSPMRPRFQSPAWMLQILWK